MDTLFQLWIFGRLFPCPRRAPHTVVFLVVSLPLSVYYYHSVRLGFPSGFTESRINRNPSIPPPHFWSCREASTPRPADYRSAALPTELQQHITGSPEQPPAVLSCCDRQVMERTMVAETTYSAWKADVLPLNYIRRLPGFPGARVKESMPTTTYPSLSQCQM